MTKYYTYDLTTKEVHLDYFGDDVMTFKSVDDARSFFEGESHGIQSIKPLDRFDTDAKFTLSVYDNNGSIVRVFDYEFCEDGAWFCNDPQASDPDLIFAGLIEQATCDFNEIGKQTGIYEPVDFACDCDSTGSMYAWIINAV